MIEGQLALAMFVVVCGILLLGFPVALTLGGTALGFAALGVLLGHFDAAYLIIIVLVILLVVLSRGIGVFVPISILSFKKKFEKNTALIITWGGLRGGLSIALALNLPDSIGSGKELILILTYAVVLFTILVQGLTLKKIVK